MSLYRPTAELPQRRALLSSAQWLTLYTIVIALIPPVYAFATEGLRSIFGYFAADTFVYLSVAANSKAGFYTFDGTHTTNGFHPLWQVTLQAIFQLFGIASDKTQQIETTFWLSVALLTASSVFTAQAVLRWTGSIAAAMLTFPGLVGLTTLLCGWDVGTPWRFMNGMESPASLLFFGLTLFYLSRFDNPPVTRPTGIDRKQLLVLSLLSCGIVFSRLDDIFLPAIIAIWLILQRSARLSQRLGAVLWFGTPLGGAVLVYLGLNHWAVGHALPVSGTAKFDILALFHNIGFLGSSLHALVPDFLYDPFSANPGGIKIADVNWRNAQMLLPAIIACMLIGRMHWLRLGRDNTFPVWIRLLLIYVVVKGLYNFLFVRLLNQGHWYFPISIEVINIVAAIMLVRAWKHWSAHAPRLHMLSVPATGFPAAVCLLLFVLGRQFSSEGAQYFEFFQRSTEIRERLEKTVANPRIIELDDGIVNYSIGVPTMSGLLFAIDPVAYSAYRSGNFLTEAARRGYQLIGSLYYYRNFKAEDLKPEMLPKTVASGKFIARNWDYERFDFQLEHKDDATGAVFIRFTPKRKQP